VLGSAANCNCNRNVMRPCMAFRASSCQ